MFSSPFAYLPFADDGAGGTTPDTVIWDRNNSSRDWTLSNGGLTANRGLNTATSWAMLLANNKQSSGTFIVTVDALGSSGATIGIEGLTNTTYPGDTASAGIGYRNDGTIRAGGAINATVATYTALDVIKVVLTATDITFYKNNVSQTTQTFAFGSLYPAASCFNATGTQLTLDPTGWGSSGVTVALTGQSLTVALGSLLASTALALTGQALSVGQGTIGIGAALSGQSLSVSQGSTTPATSAALSGQSATVARGTITASPSLALSGQSLTAAQGTLSPNTVVSLTGQASSVAQGSVTQSRSIALSGQGTAVAQGSVSPAISVAIGGQSLVVAQGTVTAVTGITAALTGQSLSVAQGSVAPALTLAINGQAISVAGGSLVPTLALAITGQALTTASGLVSVLASTDVTRALTGQSISIALGSITASVTDEHYKFWRQPPLTGRRTSPGRSR